MNGTGIKVRAHRIAYRDRVELAVIDAYPNGDWAMGRLTFERNGRRRQARHDADLGPDTCVNDPTLSLSTEQAQFLMDELWRCGLRPSEGTGSAGSLAATERHLTDMQAIAFGLLERQGVKREP